MKKKILLDKKFLQSSPTKTIRGLAATHTLLMPDVLFYEMMSCMNSFDLSVRKAPPWRCGPPAIGRNASSDVYARWRKLSPGQLGEKPFVLIRTQV